MHCVGSDVQEFTKDAWLDEQKKVIQTHLKESLMASPLYNNPNATPIESVEEVIGDPLYFAMPSAFADNGEPNPQFSARCVELREEIFQHVNSANEYSSYDNAVDWSKQMKFIWDEIVKFEDTLSPAGMYLFVFPRDLACYERHYYILYRLYGLLYNIPQVSNHLHRIRRCNKELMVI